MKKVDGFDVAAYKQRLRLLREIVSADNQADFAKRLGIPFKRWNNYERGYPVPRETAFVICDKFPGMSVEWIWWGWTGNLSKAYQDKIRQAQAHAGQLAAAEKAVAAAQEKLRLVSQKRRKAISPSASRSSR